MAVPGKKAGQEFSATVILASDEDFQVFCEPCDRDGPRLPAFGFCTNCKEHLCESCFNHHKRATLSRHHTLLDKDSMPQTQQLSSASASAGQSADFTETCAKHKKEVLKFYCNNHNVLLCSVCVTLEHTVTSCKVNYIPDISEETVNSQEFHDTLRDIDTVAEKWKFATEVTKKMIGRSSSSTKDVLEDIKKCRKEIDQHMDKLERQAKDYVSDIRQNNDKRLKEVETTFDQVKNSLKASADIVNKLNTSKQSEQLFVELKKSRQMIKELDDKFSHALSGDINVYNFYPNKAISGLLATENSLGTLSCNTLHYSSRPASNIKLKQPSHIDGSMPPNPRETLQKGETSAKSEQALLEGKLGPNPKQSSESNNTTGTSTHILPETEIQMKTLHDNKRCWITGMVLLTPYRLIANDYYNGLVKMVDTHTHSVIYQTKLSGSPWDISLVTSNELAVTLPYQKAIQIISASTSTLTEMHTLNVDGECKGISCYQRKFVVTFQKPGKLQILDIKGKPLITVQTNSSGEDIFKIPLYVRTSSCSIYVSDRGNKSVIRFNWQGQVTGHYNGILCPVGLALNDSGSLYACDCSLSGSTIHEISGDCTQGRRLLKSLTNPFAVCWCRNENKLYISSFTNTEDKHDNVIQVYKM